MVGSTWKLGWIGSGIHLEPEWVGVCALVLGKGTWQWCWPAVGPPAPLSGGGLLAVSLQHPQGTKNVPDMTVCAPGLLLVQLMALWEKNNGVWGCFVWFFFTLEVTQLQ